MSYSPFFAHGETNRELVVIVVVAVFIMVVAVVVAKIFSTLYVMRTGQVLFNPYRNTMS